MHDKLIEAMARAICCPDGCDVIGCRGRIYEREATAALAAIEAAGLVCVPREPTREMLEELSIHVEPNDGYRMMLIVSPLAKEGGA